jgi:hypothetical protein
VLGLIDGGQGNLYGDRGVTLRSAGTLLQLGVPAERICPLAHGDISGWGNVFRHHDYAVARAEERLALAKQPVQSGQSSMVQKLRLRPRGKYP